MSNVQLLPPGRTPVFRKIAIGTWHTAYDSQVYGTLTVRMERALDYIERFRKKTGKRLTVTHFLAKAVAMAYVQMPDANVVLRFTKIHPRKSIDVFLQVVMTDPETGKPDLSGVTLRDVDKMSLEEIVDKTDEKVALVRARKDKDLERTRGLMAKLPGFLIGPLMRLMSFLGYDLNLDMRWAGVPRDAFGSVMVTNIGTLGLEQAFAPLVPYSRVPMVVAVGAVTDEPVVEADRVVPGKVLRISATFDHRVLDGAHAAVLAKAVREVLGDPDRLLGPLEIEAKAADTR